MGWYKAWAAKQQGKGSLLVIAGVGATAFLWIGYSQFYKPWRSRRRLQEAEEYANVLLKSQE
ncbi:hypothetical protein TcasGA2_TC004688 [Tribolium castaneum]|uniref:Uncharacterized protein n=1 Tax=Tribolium castaneum TaxID=7070 RepID=D6W679_TRICA|nr:PREDICTED: uncharacterized protein LOC107397585 [Tribolium castaneum]EFA11091.2 hypothetical protein TcasGA2_TC004688 [Tribolium castaneum]|eukprot:XP_015833751.1 PREDICTED: uncharacterized protein LOC107397585 [Tribolium castaneum]